MVKNHLGNSCRINLDDAYERGLLKKEELNHGSYYSGTCRNANVARWNANKQVFLYIRTKFGESFIEEIKHASDDNLYDVFLAVEEVSPTDDEKIDEETFEKWRS